MKKHVKKGKGNTKHVNKHKAKKHDIVHAAKHTKTVHKKAHPTKHKHPTKSKHHKIINKHYAKKFCPSCGIELMDNHALCKKCRGTDFNFKDMKMLLCNNCGSYNYKNKWQKFSDLNNVVRILVKDNVKHDVKFEGLDENAKEELLSYKAGVHKEFIVEVSIGREHYDLPATIDVTLCPKCAKQGTKYFEGVLQVRNATPEINSYLKNDLSKQRSKGIHVNKEVDIDGTGANVDYYYTDKGYLKVIAEKLRKNFGAVIKQNAQLFSIDWSTSKNLYRLNVLVEFPNYHKNDVIKIGKQLYKIISMDEKIHVVNIETNTKTLLPHKDSYDVLKPVEVMLIKKYPEFEILDPNTYYQARLMNPSDKIQINQKIKVIIDGGEAWMVKE